MPPLKYFRPKSVPEAIELLARGIPLAGGTVVTPQRRRLEAVIDLQDLGLDGIAISENRARLGAAVRLQRFAEELADVLPHLADVGLKEAGWNLRNMATIGGTLAAGDGRSPLLCTLRALNPELSSEPGSRSLALDAYLAERGEGGPARLITELRFELPQAISYQQVARSPADRPIVCTAVVRWGSEAGARIAITLGGYGPLPLGLPEAASAAAVGDLDAAAAAAVRAYGQAEDSWASAEYRSTVAGVLVERALKELMD